MDITFNSQPRSAELADMLNEELEQAGFLAYAQRRLLDGRTSQDRRAPSNEDKHVTLRLLCPRSERDRLVEFLNAFEEAHKLKHVSAVVGLRPASTFPRYDSAIHGD